MIKIEDKDKCCGCSACMNACPQKCIVMVKDSEGFLYPKVNLDLCINCEMCEKVCVYYKGEARRVNELSTFAALSIDNQLREQSSSGGLFSIFAMQILDDNGIVYGVAMNDDCRNCSFIRVDNKDLLYKLRGSKYFQAEVGNIYRQVKKDLIDGKKVLFSGVPCQITALKLFLNKDYDCLFTVEIICHGVPSQALWNKYVNYLEERYEARINKVNFRNKKNGWHEFGLKKEGDNINQYLSFHKDPFMIMFLKNYCLRPSCYSCRAKMIGSMSDLTIADFWGIENVAPEMDDDLGTSLLIIQSSKGKKMLDDNIGRMRLKEVSFSDGIKSNPSYNSSVIKPNEREVFFIDMNNMTFRELTSKYCKKTSIFKRGMFFLKRLVKSIFCVSKTTK